MDLNSSIASYVSKKRSGMNNTSLGPSMPMHTPNCTTVSFPRLCSQQARPSALRHKGTPSPPRTLRRRPLHLIYRHINQSSYPAHGAHELSALSGVLKTGPALQACCSDHPSPHRPPVPRHVPLFPSTPLLHCHKRGVRKVARIYCCALYLKRRPSLRMFRAFNTPSGTRTAPGQPTWSHSEPY